MVAMTLPNHASAEKVACDLGLGDRSRADGCPGALTFHHAEDGAVGRVRFPGGSMSVTQFTQFAKVSAELGDGDIHLTTRGNVQIRGISDEAAFTRAVLDAGFVPSIPHDKIRNIIVSPLSDLEELVAELDQALLANDELAGLSGRTLFGIDKGDGAILAQQPDFGVYGPSKQLILGGQLTTHVLNNPAAELAEHALKWQRARGEKWRVAEDPSFNTYDTAEFEAQEPTHIGWFDREDGTVSLGAGLPFGIITAKVAELLCAVEKPVQVTPWHSVLVHDLDEGEAEAVAKVLAPMGLIFDAHSPKLLVTACTGLPGCAKSRDDVRRDALQLMASGATERTHFSGCERRCGHPRVEYTDYLALGDGKYEVSTR
ncbi:precorrin-3B synthase [Corynebacterium sp. H130]|uniref:precorrin-3B synthase n=1 Tax=Corynebacterium sp. H130 TaxID=3133444 RepID=UPI00403F3F94